MNPELLLQHFDRISEAPDAIPRFRRFILDLAVRGKLVEQDPNDEPAAELLKRIQAEKARLVKYGKIKESKEAFKSISKVLYELPASWQWVPLGITVNSHLGGGTPSKNNSAYWDGDIYWASVKDIGKGKYVDETIDRISNAGLCDSSSNLILPGNLIVVTRMGLGKISINRVPIAINQDLRALSLTSNSSIDYYYNFFKTHGFEGSGLTVKGIRVEELLNTPFPLPPLAEQHRIVAKIDELMALCDQLEAARNEREANRDKLVASSLHQLQNINHLTTRSQDAKKGKKDSDSLGALASWRETVFLQHLPRLTTRKEHIKQLRQTILNLAVQGRLVPQDPNDEPMNVSMQSILDNRAELIRKKQVRQKKLDDFAALAKQDYLPASWVVERLGNLVDPENTISYGVLVPGNETPGGIPFVRAQDLALNSLPERPNKTIDPDIEKAYARTRLKGGEILLCVVGSIGKLGIVPLSWAGANIARAVARIMPVKEISREYLLVVLQAMPVQTYFTEATRTLAQPTLNVGLIELTPIPLPPLAEQHRIVAKVEELMALCDKLEAQLTATEAYSRRLLEAVLRDALNPVMKEGIWTDY